MNDDSNNDIPLEQHIRVACEQVIQENDNNLFGERVYREFRLRVSFSNASVQEKSFRMGEVLKSNTGLPIMIFLDITLLKDQCSKLLLRGSYVSNIINN